MGGDKQNSSTAVAWRRKVRWTIGWKDFKLPLSSNYLINILKGSQNTSTNTVNVNGNTNEKLIPEHYLHLFQNNGKRMSVLKHYRVSVRC